MAEDQFKLPQTTYDQLCQIIQGYGHAEGPVTLDEVSKTVGKHSTEISRNSGFLASASIVEGTSRARTATELGRRLSRALEYDNIEQISSTWKQIVLANEFLRRVVSSVRIRGGMTESNLQSHIAYSAGVKKTTKTMTGASAVIDILRISELLKDVDGNIVVNDSVNDTVESVEEGSSIEAAPASKIRHQVTQHVIANNQPPVIINININCTPKDVDELAGKISGLINQLKNNSFDEADK